MKPRDLSRYVRIGKEGPVKGAVCVGSVVYITRAWGAVEEGVH